MKKTSFSFFFFSASTRPWVRIFSPTAWWMQLWPPPGRGLEYSLPRPDGCNKITPKQAKIKNPSNLEEKLCFFFKLYTGTPRFASKSDALFFILTEGLARFASKNDDFFFKPALCFHRFISGHRLPAAATGCPRNDLFFPCAEPGYTRRKKWWHSFIQTPSNYPSTPFRIHRSIDNSVFWHLFFHSDGGLGTISFQKWNFLEKSNPWNSIDSARC